MLRATAAISLYSIAYNTPGVSAFSPAIKTHKTFLPSVNTALTPSTTSLSVGANNADGCDCPSCRNGQFESCDCAQCRADHSPTCDCANCRAKSSCGCPGCASNDEACTCSGCSGGRSGGCGCAGCRM